MRAKRAQRAATQNFGDTGYPGYPGAPYSTPLHNLDIYDRIFVHFAQIYYSYCFDIQ